MEENAKSQSVISKEMKITGTIESSGSMRIDGKLDGELHCSGDTTIGKEANIKGNLDSNAVSVGGTVNGNINAKDKIEMKSSAKVTGDIKAKRLSIEDGVTFVGKSEVNPSGENVAPKSKENEKEKEKGKEQIPESEASKKQSKGGNQNNPDQQGKR